MIPWQEPGATSCLPSAHLLHFCPVTSGRQVHRPVICSQSSRVEPIGLQPHAATPATNRNNHCPWLPSYTLCLKNVTNLSCCGSDTHEPILIFGRNVTEKVSNKKTSYFPTLPKLVLTCGIIKQLLTFHFLSNISTKNYQHPFTYVKVIAIQSSDIFWDTVYIHWN